MEAGARERFLHDLKKVALAMRALTQACESLYEDFEEMNGGISRDSIVHLKDIQKGGTDGSDIELTKNS